MPSTSVNRFSKGLNAVTSFDEHRLSFSPTVVAALVEEHAFLHNPDVLFAAESFRVMGLHLRETQKAENPASLATSGASVWRKRRDSNPR